jgi:hypothetical protein
MDSMYLKSDAVNDAKDLKKYWLTNTWEHDILNEQDEEEAQEPSEPVASVYERRSKLKVVIEGTTGSSAASSKRVDESLYIAVRDGFDKIDWLTKQMCRCIFQVLEVVGLGFCKARTGY